MGSSDESTGRGRRSKVARVIDEDGLHELGPEMERLWTADENRRSLRTLADYFNRQLLESAVEEQDVQLLDGELENIYRLLTDDEVSSADRTRVRRQLEREGIAVEDIESDFVTYQAIRSYLKGHRDAEYTPEAANPIERQKTNLQQLRGRVTSVTEGTLEQLRANDQISLGEFRTLANIQVICEDCNVRFDVLELLGRGGCDCDNQQE